jgi:predicted kinase
MSGVPGSGKTTIARAIAQRIGAIVIDHDITKSALLEAHMPAAIAGAASYSVLNAVARHLLQQGHSVIFDSPCFYEELLERGQQLAQAAHARYRYVECVVTDLAEIDRRLRTRSRMPSQVAGVWAPPTVGSGKTQTGADVFQDWIANMKRPAAGYLTLDTTQPLDMCIEAAIAYITMGSGDL